LTNYCRKLTLWKIAIWMSKNWLFFINCQKFYPKKLFLPEKNFNFWQFFYIQIAIFWRVRQGVLILNNKTIIVMYIRIWKYRSLQRSIYQYMMPDQTLECKMYQFKISIDYMNHFIVNFNRNVFWKTKFFIGVILLL